MSAICEQSLNFCMILMHVAKSILGQKIHTDSTYEIIKAQHAPAQHALANRYTYLHRRGPANLLSSSGKTSNLDRSVLSPGSVQELWANSYANQGAE